MQLWNADHFFRMGSTHKVCEDYALSSGDTLHPNSCQAILSDGCSLCLDSDNHPIAAHTDFGSRLLVKAAQQVSSDWSRLGSSFRYGNEESLRRTVERAWMWCNDLCFNLNTLSGTLLFANISDDLIRWFIVGDGAFATRDRETKNWVIANVTFESGRPYYLRYEMNKEDRRRYMADFTGFSIRRQWLYADGTCGPTWDQTHGFTEGKIPHYSSSVDIDRTDLVVMFSDGISSFVRKDPTTGQPVAVPLSDAMRPFLALKNFRGEFVYRRANAALKQFAADGITHTDDFSMIAIFAE